MLARFVTTSSCSPYNKILYFACEAHPQHSILSLLTLSDSKAHALIRWRLRTIGFMKKVSDIGSWRQSDTQIETTPQYCTLVWILKQCLAFQDTVDGMNKIPARHYNKAGFDKHSTHDRTLQLGSTCSTCNAPFRRSAALLNLCISVHALEFSASEICRMMSFWIFAEDVSSSEDAPGIGTAKLPPPALLWMLNRQRKTARM